MRASGGIPLKCFACHCELTGSPDRCDCCGLPLFFPVFSASELQADILDSTGALYLKEWLKDLRIYLVTHYYQLEEGYLIPDYKKEELLVSGEALSYGKIAWSKLQFLRVEATQSLALEIVIQKADIRKTLVVPVQTPNRSIRGRWRVGVLLNPALRAQIAVGAPDTFEISGAFPLSV